MPSYLFDVGNSSVGPLGLCARVKAPNEEEALATLAEYLESHTGALGEIEMRRSDDDDCAVEYCNVYVNPDGFKIEDISEGETEDDEEEVDEDQGDA